MVHASDSMCLWFCQDLHVYIVGKVMWVKSHLFENIEASVHD